MNPPNWNFGAFPAGFIPGQLPYPVINPVPLTTADIITAAASQPPPPPPPEKKKKKKTSSDKSVEMLCEICNIYCSSMQMYDDHCAGKKHQRKEREAKIYNCETCGIFCLTATEQQEHFNTQLHEESLKVREYLDSQVEVDEDDNNEEYDDDGLTAEDLEDLKASKNKLIYKICDLCKVQTNSKQMWEIHVASKKHKSREQAIAINKKIIAEQFSCAVCEVLCYSAEERESHLQSNRHAEILREKNYMDQKTAEKSSTATAEQKSAETVTNVEDKDNKNLQAPMVEPIRAGDNSMWYPCDLCKVKMNSMENYKDHMNSIKHKAKEKGYTIDRKTKTQKYRSEAVRRSYQEYVKSNLAVSSNCKDPSSFCPRCDIQFDTIVQLEDHFLTPEHKSVVSKRKKLNISAVPPIGKIKVKTDLVSANYGYGHREFEPVPAPSQPSVPTIASIPPPHFFQHMYAPPYIGVPPPSQPPAVSFTPVTPVPPPSTSGQLFTLPNSYATTSIPPTYF